MSEAIKKMEPEAHQLIEEAQHALRSGGEVDTSLTMSAAAVSIAISLKRIADAICYQDAGRNIFDFLQVMSENTRDGP